MKKKPIGAICIVSVMSILLTGCCLFHDWQEATCTTPKTCAKCGETEGEALGHDWQEATCTEAKTCSVCGKTKGEALGHNWQEATCTEPKTCSICGETEGGLLEHNWQDATCQRPKTCSVCKITEGEMLEHSWREATCLAAKVCMVCGETEGDVGDHTWVDATCLTPRTCKVCGTTEGETGDHIWVEATCSAPRTCNICGKTEGNKEPHKYDGRDYCLRCGIRGKVNLTKENIINYLVPAFSRIDYVEGHEGAWYYTSDDLNTWWHLTISPKSDEYIFSNFKVYLSLRYVPVGADAYKRVDVTSKQSLDIDTDGNGSLDVRYLNWADGLQWPLYEVKIIGFQGDCYIK